MIGITLPELVRFFMQVCAAAAGAASFWGLVLSLLGRKSKNLDKKRSEAHDGFAGLSSILMFVFGLFFAGFIFFWWFGISFIFAPFSIAHEGIKLDPLPANLQSGFALNALPVLLLSIFGLTSLYFWKHKHRIFKNWAPLFFLIQFLLLGFILSNSVLTESYFSRSQTFFSFHNFHSIFTLGSVIIVDILYITTLNKNNLKKVLYPFFPWISLAIWVGLGLDFLSVTLVFDEAFKWTSQFLFSQTVVGIIILNGLLLSERLNEILIRQIKSGTPSLSARFQKIAGISGAVSIVSWTSITFVDFFVLTANYTVLIIFYLLAITLFYFLEPILAKALNIILDKTLPAESLESLMV